MLNTVRRPALNNGQVLLADIAPGSPSAGPVILVNASKSATLNRAHRVAYLGPVPVTLTLPNGLNVGDRVSVFIESIGTAPSVFTLSHGTRVLLSFGAPMFSQQYLRFEWAGSTWILL